MMAGVSRITQSKNVMEKEKKRADMLEEENEMIKGKLLEAQAEREDATAGERENTLHMIDKALRETETSEEVENKRRQDNVLVSPVDDAITAPPKWQDGTILKTLFILLPQRM